MFGKRKHTTPTKPAVALPVWTGPGIAPCCQVNPGQEHTLSCDEVTPAQFRAHLNIDESQDATTSLERHRVPTTHGWRYEFPNGYDASVINDPHRPFRFEILSDALDAPGGQVVGLTSQQVEAKLHHIAALPAN